MVADALSWKSHCHAVQQIEGESFNLLHLASLHNVTVTSTLRARIVEGQKTDKGISHIKQKVKENPSKNFRVDDEGVLWFNDRLVVPKDRKLRAEILTEAHSSIMSIHPGSSKMYKVFGYPVTRLGRLGRVGIDKRGRASVLMYTK